MLTNGQWMLMIINGIYQSMYVNVGFIIGDTTWIIIEIYMGFSQW